MPLLSPRETICFDRCVPRYIEFVFFRKVEVVPKHLSREGETQSHLAVLMHPPFRRAHLPIPHSKTSGLLKLLPYRQSFPAWRYPEGSRVSNLTPKIAQFLPRMCQNTLNDMNLQR